MHLKARFDLREKRKLLTSALEILGLMHHPKRIGCVVCQKSVGTVVCQRRPHHCICCFRQISDLSQEIIADHHTSYKVVHNCKCPSKASCMRTWSSAVRIVMAESLALRVHSTGRCVEHDMINVQGALLETAPICRHSCCHCLLVIAAFISGSLWAWT